MEQTTTELQCIMWYIKEQELSTEELNILIDMLINFRLEQINNGVTQEEKEYTKEVSLSL